MKTAVAACIVACFAFAGPAVAHDKKSGAKVLRAKLTATAAATAAGVPDVRGRAQLVDGKRRNKVSLHVRNLKPGETYIWHVHQATAKGDPCDPASGVGNPAPYPGWQYRALVANEAGNANSKGRSTTFPVDEPVDTGKAYYVNVHLQDGTVIACGVLKAKRGERHKPRGHGGKHEDRSGDARKDHEHGHGRPDHAHGHSRP